MTLAEWLDKYRKTDAWFGHMVRKDRSHISRLRRGLVRPSLELMIQIREFTDGEVNLESWGNSNE